ncbi:hypothetical protein [Ruegeria marina]|uniref:hypothetical protein n=1 Tax=Ruegeria marina TaxID=639004 RepID=UPI00115F8A04|nr:hypothetical protein [Ruegeria marina]
MRRLDLTRIDFRALCLLPLVARDGQRITQTPILQAARHVLAMFGKERTRHIGKLRLVVGQVDRAHLLGIDARPHNMRIASAIISMEENGAGLSFQPQLFSIISAVFSKTSVSK